MSSGGDSGGEGCLFLLAIIFGAAMLLAWLANIAVVIALIFGCGVLVNLAVRVIPNELDWRTINRNWIWLAIAWLVLVPILGGAFLLAAIGRLAAESGSNAGTIFFLVPAYFIWLAGYVWASFSPRCELGMADTVMASTLILTWARLKAWWLEQEFEWRLASLDKPTRD